jgi:hypothetical protein
MTLTDRAEKTFNMVPTEQDKEKLGEIIPKVTVVDRSGDEKKT